jgi:hypothetical protein
MLGLVEIINRGWGRPVAHFVLADGGKVTFG